MPVVGLALGVAQTAYGAIKAGSDTKKLNALLGQRKAFVTPEEINKILNASEQKSQGDTLALGYETNQIDRAFGQVLGSAELLGADPNDLAGLFDQKMQGIIKTGQEFHASNMESFGKYLGALNLKADNKTAEWQSQQDILKDKIQAATGNKADDIKNISSGINTFVGSLSSMKEMDLYKESLKNKK